MDINYLKRKEALEHIEHYGVNGVCDIDPKYWSSKTFCLEVLKKGVCYVKYFDSKLFDEDFFVQVGVEGRANLERAVKRDEMTEKGKESQLQVLDKHRFDKVQERILNIAAETLAENTYGIERTK